MFSLSMGTGVPRESWLARERITLVFGCDRRATVSQQAEAIFLMDEGSTMRATPEV